MRQQWKAPSELNGSVLQESGHATSTPQFPNTRIGVELGDEDGTWNVIERTIDTLGEGLISVASVVDV